MDPADHPDCEANRTDDKAYSVLSVLEDAVYEMAVEQDVIDRSVLRKFVALYPEYEDALTDAYEALRLDQSADHDPCN